ncbi:MAG TPA: transcription termination/antitermination NusG family protein [Candidatus Acidoferrum sp.]|nr:transcription termination/antitermination NusG family protein [Candidatus Acidoferrum sp.]
MGIRSQQWPWFAILVRTGREKSANLLLENSGYECILPVCKSTRRWSDRTKVIEVPLFPGYLFCRMNPHNRLTVLMTPGVMQIVGVGKTPIPVEQEEIEAIQRVQKSGLSAMPWPYIQIGNVAQILQGPLRGLTGIIVKIKSGVKLVLSVSLLQRSVAVEVERNWVGEVQPGKPAEVNAIYRRQSPVLTDAIHHLSAMKGVSDETIQAD